VNYLLYFKTWLYACWNLPLDYTKVICLNEMVNRSQLAHFLPVTLTVENGLVQAELVPNNGSGDFLSLVNSDGFIQLDPNSELQKGSLLTFIPSDFLL
jgi:molybdopterin biosynthesis enzyme